MESMALYGVTPLLLALFPGDRPLCEQLPNGKAVSLSLLLFSASLRLYFDRWPCIGISGSRGGAGSGGGGGAAFGSG